MRLAYWLRTGLLALIGLAAVRAPAQSPASSPYAGKIGIELEGVGDGSRSMPFVDAAKTVRAWQKPGGGVAPTDANGWPESDCSTCVFDIRPCAAWSGPDQIDDPDRFQPDWGGVYHLSLHGRAQIEASGSDDLRLQNLKYDATSDTTTAEAVVGSKAGLFLLSFSKTRRAADAPEGSGFTDLRLIRPGYPADSKQLFTDPFLRALKPFRVLRFMDWLATNDNPGFYGDAGHHALEWKDRSLPGDATQVAAGGKRGVCWEYVVALANETGKDLWINIPVAATDDYIRSLAAFLKDGLKANQAIYLEHSNEVWNYGFPQYIYNKLAAKDEVARGGSPLNNDGDSNEEDWACRRHAKRLYEIAKIFEGAFGPGSLDVRIRPVYASWFIRPASHYAKVLKWCEATFGPPKHYFYGIADAPYFNAEGAPKDASADQILAAMRASIDRNAAGRGALQAIADQYGLKHLQYEAGPDVGGGSRENVANRIRANRDPRMKDLIAHDIVDEWFAKGGDLYMYFALSSGYSRYGCWGLSEDIRDLNTPKREAIDAIVTAVVR